MGGAQDLFKVLSGASGGESRMEVAALATHPLTADRIAAVESYAVERGWPLSGVRTPIGKALAEMKVLPAKPNAPILPGVPSQ